MPGRGSLAVAVVVVAALLASSAQASSARTAASTARTACPGALSLQPAARQAATVRCLVNWVRLRHGRNPLHVSAALQRAARRKAAAVIRCHAFSHRPCGVAASAGARAEGYAIRAWGENLYVAEGALATPLATIRAWLASPGHRAVLLAPVFSDIGVAIVPNTQVAGIGHGRMAVLQLGAARS